MFKKTLICLDGSKAAEEIIPFIMESCPVSGSEVILLHVSSSALTIPPPQSIHSMTYSIRARPVKTPVSDIGESVTLEPQARLQLGNIEKEQSDARRYLRDIARSFRVRGLKVRTIILEGEPGSAILNYAESNKISLIALTTHGSGSARRGMLGGVAQRILKEAAVPVLIIKPAGAAGRD